MSTRVSLREILKSDNFIDVLPDIPSNTYLDISYVPNINTKYNETSIYVTKDKKLKVKTILYFELLLFDIKSLKWIVIREISIKLNFYIESIENEQGNALEFYIKGKGIDQITITKKGEE